MKMNNQKGREVAIPTDSPLPDRKGIRKNPIQRTEWSANRLENLAGVPKRPLELMRNFVGGGKEIDRERGREMGKG